MIIQFLGHACFKLKCQSATVLTDPFSPKAVGLPLPKTNTDIVTISHHHKDHDDLSRLNNPAFILDGPGEYEVKGISIFGLLSFHNKEKETPNIIFIIESEGIRICHLGDLGQPLDDKQLEYLNGIDVLLINTGDKRNNQLSVEQTVKLINQIEPAIIIPMHSLEPEMDQNYWQNKATLPEFIKEYGNEGERMEKLVVSKASLPEETKLVILDRKK